MRTPWRLLTLRGRAFLVVGLVVALGAMAAGQRDLMRIGLLLIALPLVALVLVARSRLRLSCERAVEPAQVALGSPMRGKILLGQDGRLPAGILLLEDQVPRELGSRPRFLVDKADLSWRREVDYPLLGRVRGKFHTGPLRVRTADAFGLVRLDRQFTANTEIRIIPQVVPLPPLRSAGGAGNTGDARPHKIGVIGQDDALVREYRQGDDVRRIHWRSSARWGELMVRREEQAWDPSAAIVLDSRIGSHAGRGMRNSLEWAVSAAASIALHYLEDNFSVELYDAGGSMRISGSMGQHSSASAELVLDRLTELSAQHTTTLHYAVEAATDDNPSQLVIAIVGRLRPDDADALIRIRRERANGLALVLDVDSFADLPAAEATRHQHALAVELLRENQWRVVEVPRGMSVADAWTALDDLSRGRLMRSFDRLGIAAALSLVLATFTLTPLTQDSSFLGPSWLLIGLITVLSLLLRRARLGGAAVLSAQLLVLVGFVLTLAVTMPGEGEPIYDHLGTLLMSGVEHMQGQSAPMQANDGVKLMFVAGVGLMMVLTDLVAIGIRRPVWALAPPAALFMVPAVGLRTDTGIVAFACIAIGYLGILIADGLNSTARWTRGLSRDSAEGFGTATPVVWRAASLVGVPALVLTLLFGAALPTLSLPGFGLGVGTGPGGPLQLSDPTLDLRRNLNLPADVKVLEYRTDRSNGVYLRLAALPKFSNGGWSNVTTRLNPGTEIGLIPGVQDRPEQARTTQLRVFDFGSEYLPLPYAPRSIDVDGRWAYDPNTLVVLSIEDRGGRTNATRNLSYTVSSLDTEPTGEQLANAAAGTPADDEVTREIPVDLPASLTALTEDVIKGKDTPALKAAAIQNYLRSTRFTYSTKTLPGAGYTALENFLLRDHTGYCEQFAGAMAMMARVAGIPSRVAVGFLPGEKRADGTWEVSVHKMHAWPELYFAGFGWVRFEPTPGSVTGTAPIWTVPQAQQPGDDPTVPRTSASAAEDTTSANVTNLPVDQHDPGSAAQSVSPLRTALLVGGGLLALLILAAPATIRVRRRGARLSGDTAPEERVESAWAEIRDTVVDYGGTWPSGSPRSIGLQIGERLDPAESDAMASVATLVERARYSRGLGADDSTRAVASLTRNVRRGLGAPQTRRRRLRATLLPRSLFRRSID